MVVHAPRISLIYTGDPEMIVVMPVWLMCLELLLSDVPNSTMRLLTRDTIARARTTHDARCSGAMYQAAMRS